MFAHHRMAVRAVPLVTVDGGKWLPKAIWPSNGMPWTMTPLAGLMTLKAMSAAWPMLPIWGEVEHLARKPCSGSAGGEAVQKLELGRQFIVHLRRRHCTAGAGNPDRLKALELLLQPLFRQVPERQSRPDAVDRRRFPLASADPVKSSP